MANLSVFVTTFNNERTLAACLESVRWADEIVLLDSFSTDATVAIAERYGCRVFRHEFLGYGRQKRLALEHTRNRWVLLLDADEALSPQSQEEIRALLAGEPDADGYEIPRQEQLFWRMCSPRVRLNAFLRLFDKTKGGIDDLPVHAAPKVEGRVRHLRHPFYHFGETDLHTKIDKINHYSTGLVPEKLARGRGRSPWILVFYPPVYFLRTYLFKRNFLNGWAGFITSVCAAFYVFLKYAKVYEERQFRRYGTRLMPPGAPSSPRPARTQRY